MGADGDISIISYTHFNTFLLNSILDFFSKKIRNRDDYGDSKYDDNGNLVSFNKTTELFDTIISSTDMQYLVMKITDAFKQFCFDTQIDLRNLDNYVDPENYTIDNYIYYLKNKCNKEDDYFDSIDSNLSILHKFLDILNEMDVFYWYGDTSYRGCWTPSEDGSIQDIIKKDKKIYKIFHSKKIVSENDLYLIDEFVEYYFEIIRYDKHIDNVRIWT